MSSLILPPGAASQEHNHMIDEMTHGVETMRYFDEQLWKISPLLRLVRAGENSNTPALKPGYWHVLKLDSLDPQNGPVTVFPVEHKDGSFREPDSSLFEDLKSSNLWDDRVLRDRKELQRKLTLAAQNEKNREREAMAEEIVDRVRSRNNASTGWRASIA